MPHTRIFDEDEGDEHGGFRGGGGAPLPADGPSSLPGNDVDKLQLLTASLGNPIPLAYGRHLVRGNQIFQHEDGALTKLFVALGDGQWDGVEVLFINGKVTLLSATAHFHPGIDGETGTETTPNNGNQKICSLWPTTYVDKFTFSNTAYMALSLAEDTEAPRPGFDVLGIYRTRKIRIFDSTGTITSFVYSTNPAWICLDVLIEHEIRKRALVGSALSTAQKARVDFQSFIDWAADCDFDIGGGKKRFEANIAITRRSDLKRGVELLLLIGRAYLNTVNGKIRAKMDKARSAVATITRDEIIEDALTFGRKSTRSLANRVKSQYRNLKSGDGVGTISTTGTTLTGTGTKFKEMYREGEPIQVRSGPEDEEVQVIDTITSDTAGTLKAAFSVNQTTQSHGNPALDFQLSIHDSLDETSITETGKEIEATVDLGNMDSGQAERTGNYLRDRTGLLRRAGFILPPSGVSVGDGPIDWIPGDVVTGPKDVESLPADTELWEILEAEDLENGSRRIGVQIFDSTIFTDAESSQQDQTQTVENPGPIVLLNPFLPPGNPVFDSFTGEKGFFQFGWTPNASVIEQFKDQLVTQVQLASDSGFTTNVLNIFVGKGATRTNHELPRVTRFARIRQRYYRTAFSGWTNFGAPTSVASGHPIDDAAPAGDNDFDPSDPRFRSGIDVVGESGGDGGYWNFLDDRGTVPGRCGMGFSVIDEFGLRRSTFNFMRQNATGTGFADGAATVPFHLFANQLRVAAIQPFLSCDDTTANSDNWFFQSGVSGITTMTLRRSGSSSNPFIATNTNQVGHGGVPTVPLHLFGFQRTEAVNAPSLELNETEPGGISSRMFTNNGSYVFERVTQSIDDILINTTGLGVRRPPDTREFEVQGICRIRRNTFAQFEAVDEQASGEVLVHGTGRAGGAGTWDLERAVANIQDLLGNTTGVGSRGTPATGFHLFSAEIRTESTSPRHRFLDTTAGQDSYGFRTGTGGFDEFEFHNFTTAFDFQRINPASDVGFQGAPGTSEITLHGQVIQAQASGIVASRYHDLQASGGFYESGTGRTLGEAHLRDGDAAALRFRNIGTTSAFDGAPVPGTELTVHGIDIRVQGSDPRISHKNLDVDGWQGFTQANNDTFRIFDTVASNDREVIAKTGEAAFGGTPLAGQTILAFGDLLVSAGFDAKLGMRDTDVGGERWALAAAGSQSPDASLVIKNEVSLDVVLRWNPTGEQGILGNPQAGKGIKNYSDAMEQKIDPRFQLDDTTASTGIPVDLRSNAGQLSIIYNVTNIFIAVSTTRISIGSVTPVADGLMLSGTQIFDNNQRLDSIERGLAAAGSYKLLDTGDTFFNFLRADDVGTDVTLNIGSGSSFNLSITVRYPGKDVSINAGTITGLLHGERYFIFYDDETFSGGAVTYNATTSRSTALNGKGRIFVGTVFAPANSAANVDKQEGGWDGGLAGATSGLGFRLFPRYVDRTESTTGNGNFVNIQNIFDGRSSTPGQIKADGNSAANHAEVIIRGFPAAWMLFKQFTLKVTSEVQNTTDEATAVKARLSRRNGPTATWVDFFTVVGTTTRSKTEDGVGFVGVVNPSQIEVRGEVDTVSGDTTGTINLLIHKVLIELDF